jgi:hypothetical protein
MNQRDQVLVTFEPKSTRWMLPPSETGQLVLIGWRLAGARPVDGGMPPPIADALCQGLVQCSWVSFFDAAEPPSSPEVRVGKVVVSGIGPRLRALSQRLPGTVFQVSTRQADVAASAFDASLFSWSMQGQVLLLSPPDHPPRVLSWAEMWSLSSRERSITSDSLEALNVQAALFPGVDGDVGGLVSADPEAQAGILAALQMGVEAAGMNWRVLSEEQFIRGI